MTDKWKVFRRCLLALYIVGMLVFLCLAWRNGVDSLTSALVYGGILVVSQLALFPAIGLRKLAARPPWYRTLLPAFSLGFGLGVVSVALVCTVGDLLGFMPGPSAPYITMGLLALWTAVAGIRLSQRPRINGLREGVVFSLVFTVVTCAVSTISDGVHGGPGTMLGSALSYAALPWAVAMLILFLFVWAMAQREAGAGDEGSRAVGADEAIPDAAN